MTKLHIDTIGKGPPLVLIHGWGWHSGIWHPLIPLLKNHYQLHLIDLPGSGQSPVFNGYTCSEIAPLLLSQVPLQAAWLGWSMGGLFAMWIAAHYPDRVTSLITVASNPKFISSHDWPGMDLVTLDKFSNLLVNDYRKTILNFLELQLRGSPNQHDLFEELNNKLFENNPCSLSTLSNGLTLLKNSDLRSIAKLISCPNIHFFGQHDRIVPFQVANLMKNLIPNAQVEIIKRTGHMPFLTHRENFITCLNQFLF